MSYPLNSVLLVMKPNKVDLENKDEVARLDSLLDSPEWAAEEKIDGCHYSIINSQFFSTRISKGKEIPVEKTDNYPHLVAILDRLDLPNLVLDGEIFITGKTSQYVTRVTGSGKENAISFQEQNGYVKYKLFDILRTPKGTWLNNVVYFKRREMLEHFFYKILDPLQKEMGCSYFELVDSVTENKREYVDDLLARGLEGAVLKKLSSTYIFGKKPKWQWMKLKKNDETDCVIMGFDEPTRIYTGANTYNWPFWEDDVPVTKLHAKKWIGAVVVGQYDTEGVLQKRASVSGLDESIREDMSRNPDKYLGRVCKITFMEYTEDGNLRHPMWQGLHEDKNPEECVWGE